MAKSLYINNKRVIIDSENTYFPFTYKISTLEDVSIIGVPVSKTVTIPRCPVNDEIFGFIGNLNRVTIGGQNNLIGVSFNQTKKAIYELYNESELISTGLLIVNDITYDNYEIELVDIIIDKIESFSDVYLSDLDIINDDNSIYTKKLTAANIVNANNNIQTIRPVINIKDRDSNGTSIQCKYNNGTLTPYYNTVEFPEDVTPVQVKSLKNSDVDFAITLNNVMKSINQSENKVGENGYNTSEHPNIIVDTKLTSMFDELNIMLTPKKEQTYPSVEYLMDGFNLPTFTNSPEQTQLYKSKILVGGSDLIQLNGNYYIELEFELNTTASEDSPWISSYIDSTGTHGFNKDTPDGTFMGELYFDTYFSSIYSYDSSVRYSSIPQTQLIRLIKGVNVSYTMSGPRVNTIKVIGKVLLKVDYYPNLLAYTYPIYLNFDFTKYSSSSRNTKLYNTTYCNNTVTINPSKITYNTLDLRTGDTIKGQNLYPKVSIKDFILNTCKFFNLGVKVLGNDLYIFKKVYYQSPDILLLDDSETSIKTNLITNSKIKLKSGLPDTSSFVSDILKTYETTNNKVYGEQILNTGYSIKENIKEVSFDPSIPILVTDINNFAYDRFANTFQGGYSYYPLGFIDGLIDKIVYGYLNKVIDKTYISDDSFYEAGMKSIYDTRIPTEQSFKMLNSLLQYNSLTNTFQFTNALAYNDVNTEKLDYYFTLSPYQFNSNGGIVKSLDFNKPLYNWAFITDSVYPDNITLYNIYHKNMLSDLLSVDTHTIKSKCYIDGNIDIFKIYNISNSNYIISNLPEYDPTQPGMYEIELTRVNNINNYLNTFKTVNGIVNINSTSVSSGAITITSEITFDGWGTVNSKGICWGTTINPLWSPDGIESTSPDNIYTLTTPNIGTGTYYVRAYLENDGGVAYSDNVIVVIP